MKVLYAASEAVPFVKTGGLADVAGSLPAALTKEGVDARVILPLYEGIGDEWRSQMTFIMYTYVFLSWRRQYCGLFKLEHKGVTYYFIDNEYYFKRSPIYGHYDDGERFGFFSKAVFQLLPLLEGWKPDVVHCNDWQTALIPVYIRQSQDPFYHDIRTIFTIHNIEYQGRFGPETMEDLFGLPRQLLADGRMAYEGDVDLMKGAIYMADAVTTVSPTYAQELQDPYYGCGLHQVIRENAHKLRGILNGIDTEDYNPATDESLYRNYSAKAPGKKVYNKLELQRMFGLQSDGDVPMLVCISRLVGHKGFDLVTQGIHAIMSKNLQMVVLGTGDWQYEEAFRWAQREFARRFSANILYSGSLSRKLYAAADLFLMPSKSEPCGLSQMIAMRYGALPIVRSTGGLRDTVIPHPAEDANGFAFYDYTVSGMLGALDAGLEVWYDKQRRDAMIHRAMTADFTWGRSAKAYVEIYKEIRGIL